MTKFGVAQPVRRVEDPRLLKGAGSYTADYTVAGMLHGVVLRSPHANAKILSLNVSAAALSFYDLWLSDVYQCSIHVREAVFKAGHFFAVV